MMVVEDDPAVRTVVADHLRLAGCLVSQHRDGARAWEAFQADRPDLLVLDRMLPGLSGDDLCRRVREVSTVPIIMLTALDGLENRIDGLESGADDYLAKPFSLRELQLRVNAQLRRNTPSEVDLVIDAGPFRIDAAHRRVWIGDREITLTTREYELMLYLVRNPGRVVSRDEILREVWRWGFGDASTVTVHVRRLREKIESDPRNPVYLQTEWGAGYRFGWGR
ncbi:Two component transcriptional regulator, winged helix family OS=Tsukamurella paurometabola (strain ATCC 8368 / DSM / CCUG 35730 / CIP 100753 / JCM 10117/ KCTC 9821 / NBRC 16120 / NCIMB 702349 / NCTC 13040) OX=521096 GN=Tpau_2015 PE=4 SV=1 [Tsukamurella paurometabola]|nr:Sensory transduction protein regX3 [Tsukamurella paurometabola]